MWRHDGGGRHEDGYGAASGEVVVSTELPSSPPLILPSLPTTALFLVLPSSTSTDRPRTDPPTMELAALCSIGLYWGGPAA